nr:uncharacterized protein LOC109158301 isoform X5 [Ipomoea batatas]
MATAAFKSTSKRGTATNATNPNSRENPTPASSSSSKPLRRRSLSVSAISRSTSQDASSEFSNKRDNPLAPNSAAENRGRSTTRSSGGVRNGIGRSVSRVRGRSVSRGHYGSAYESEKEQELILLQNSKQSRELKQVANSFKGSTLVEKNTDTCGRVNRSKIATVRGQGIECSEDDSASFRDGHWVNDTAASGIYETVRAEVRRAISDIQSDLQSYMRSLALQLEAFFSLLYKFVLSMTEQRSLLVLLALRSNERKKMTQRLSEDAMAYFDHFDECVSISTFDSSDLSAPEDPPHSSIGATSVSRSLFEPQGSMDSFSANKKILGGIDLMGGNEGSGLTAAASNSKEPALLQGEQVQFSFTQKSPKPSGDDGIRSCIKRFERDAYKDAIDSEIIVSHYDASEYKLQSQIESLWFDRMLYSSRIESGGLHLCGGGIAVVSFPFGS